MAKSQIIYGDAHYTACAMKDGSLIITSTHKQWGVRIVGKEAIKWISEINTAIDASEAHMLCRSIVNTNK